MADVAIGRGMAVPRSREDAIDWLIAHREILAVGAIMVVAAVLHFWGLGDKAFHHDESLHATYSWYFYDGRGYEHNPLMHGPFQFHAAAAMMFLFGDTDFTVRICAAVFGTILCAMPYLLRKQIGMTAVIIAMVLLTISPTLLYFGRFLREDIYTAVWTFAIVICVWRYLDEGKDIFLYGLGAAMALSFATKEVTFITVAVLLVFLDLALAVELGKRSDGGKDDTAGSILRSALIAPVAFLIAGLWPLLGKRPFGRERLPLAGDLLVVAGTLALPQFSAAIQVLTGDKGYDVPAEDTLRIVTVSCLLIVSVYVGLMWRPKTWLLVAAAFYVPFILLYTTFFTNLDGFFSGIWGSLDYWLGQHDVRRGNQPIYYYTMLTPLYEFLPLIAAAAGAVWLALRGDTARRWLLFWFVGVFIGLSVAGEKMPWLEAHIALPLALIAAVALSKAIEALDLTGSRWATAIVVGTVTVASVMLMVDGDGTLRVLGFVAAALLGVWLLVSFARDLPSRLGSETVRLFSSPELLWSIAALVALGVFLAAASRITTSIEALFAVWVLALVPVVIVGHLFAVLLRRSKSFGRGVLVIGIAALATLTVRASITAAFTHDDTPVEMLVYTQTSPDIPKIRDRIDQIAAQTGLGHNLPIVVDGDSSFAWPWAWYLRDYHSVSYASISANYQPPPGAILLISRTNVAKIDASQYTQTPYKHRWWFCETYRDPEATCRTDGSLNFRQATDILTDPARLKSLAHFFLYRRPAATTTGSVDAVAFFPLEYGVAQNLPPRESTVLADGRILLGSQTANPASHTGGEFSQPGDVFVDGTGNVWVADSLNNRIQKFDSQGHFLGQFGTVGTGEGQFTEPWSVAVDADGFIYVADTWNHRIQKFDPTFKFVTMWGQPGANNPGPLDFFGPRDIVIAADSTLWITDTGNQRLLHFTKDGQPIDVYGSAGSDAGQFSEPVGLAADTAGDLVVADAWNGRVQVLPASGEPPYAFTTQWTSHEVVAKPYVSVLSDGRVLISVPETGSLVLYTASGSRVGTWKPLVDSMPIGVAPTADGGFVFSDGRRNEVQVVPGRLIAGLFQP
jgi:uncharacterized protein (TIGR03663 family)